MSKRLKQGFDAPREDGSDLAKIVAILSSEFWPHVRAHMDGDEAVIQFKNKAVWINSRCLVSGEVSIPDSR